MASAHNFDKAHKLMAKCYNQAVCGLMESHSFVESK
jgi:hypothetical protein